MLGITPKWLDGTSVGGCSYMLHVRHAAAAISAGLCTTALITHGEFGRSQVGAVRYASNPAGLLGQFETPYGIAAPVTQVGIPALRYMKETGTTEEDLALLAVIQREWAGKESACLRSRALDGRRCVGVANDLLSASATHVLCRH